VVIDYAAYSIISLTLMSNVSVTPIVSAAVVAASIDHKLCCSTSAMTVGG
jgi:hypothetical protein